MIPEVVAVKVAGPHSLRLTFRDGVDKQVDLLPLLVGPIFQPLRDPSYFRQVLLDPAAGTVVWPNGADVAPETLYALPSEALSVRSGKGQSLGKTRRRTTGSGRVAERPTSPRRPGAG
jgi:hypothetical protein